MIDLEYAINQLVEKKGFKLSGEKGKIRELASDEDHKVVSIRDNDRYAEFYPPYNRTAPTISGVRLLVNCLESHHYRMNLEHPLK